MAIMDVNPVVKKGSGGGLFGKLAGLGSGLASVAGLAAAPFTGGASLAAGGAVAGALGGAATVANTLQPGSADSRGPTVQQTPAERRLQSDPRNTIATINESLSALQRADQKTRAAYEPFLLAAKQTAESRLV